MDGNEGHDWCAMFAGCTLPDGSTIRVVQASWIEVEVTVYEDTGNAACTLTLTLALTRTHTHTCSPRTYP